MAVSFTASSVFKTLEKISYKRPATLPFKIPRAFGRRIVVRPLEMAENGTINGIILTEDIVDTLQKFNMIAVIDSVGDLVDPVWGVKEGMFIVMPKYSGDEVYFKNQRFLSIFDEQVVMIIDNPEELINFAKETTNDSTNKQ